MFKQFGILTCLIHLIRITTGDDDDLDEYRTMREGEFPYVVRVKSDTVRCIGTLVSYTRFVTAGRCFAHYDTKTNNMVMKDIKRYAVYGGSAYFFSSNIEGRDIIQCHVHPMFSPRPDHNYYHDIALVELNRPFAKTFRIKPMDLWSDLRMKAAWMDVVMRNKTCYSVGWSWSLYECDRSRQGALYLKFGWKYLQVMQVKPMPNETCRKYASTGENMECLGEVCTWGFNYYSGPCGGDPGSPIICDGQPLGLHMANIICGQVEIAHFYQLFWPYMSYFHSPDWFQGLSGSNRSAVDPFLLFVACICSTLSILYTLNK